MSDASETAVLSTYNIFADKKGKLLLTRTIDQ